MFGVAIMGPGKKNHYISSPHGNGHISQHLESVSFYPLFTEFGLVLQIPFCAGV